MEICPKCKAKGVWIAYNCFGDNYYCCRCGYETEFGEEV